MSVFLESIAIGIIAGFAVVAFRLLLENADALRALAYEHLRISGALWMVGWLLFLTLAGLFLGWMSDRRPMIRGSGIPQIKGALLRRMRLEWLPELPMKIIGGVLSIGLGLSLGREGPSVQIGAYVGKGVLGVARRPAVERKFLLTSGAAAGLSAAFNAPLAGVLFALEELHKHFSPQLLACAMGASVAADVVASRFFGLRPAFDFHQIVPLQTGMLHWVVLLGVICAVLGDVFKRLLYAAQDMYAALRIPQVVRPAAALLISVPLSFFLYDATGGGHALIEELWRGNKSLTFLLLVFAAKMLFSAASYGSGTAGGIFLPLLACGALTGKIFGLFLYSQGFVQETAPLNFMILGMAAFFSGVVRAPVTGAVLILEMSGNFNHFVSLVACCLIAFVAGDLIRSRPVYDVLLERILAKMSPGYHPGQDKTVLLEIPVSAGSRISHSYLRSVPWPWPCRIVGIERGEEDILPNGETVILPGDRLLVLTEAERAPEIKKTLLDMGDHPE